MKKLFVFFFAAILAVTGISVFAGGDRVFSANENRYLTVASDVKTSSLITGDFQNRLTEYVSDQMPGRDWFMETATFIKKKTGRKDIGGVYIGKEGFYFDKKLDKDIDRERFRSNLKKVEATAEKFKDKDVSLLLVPESGRVYSDRLPENGEIFEHDKLYDEAEKILSACRLVDPRRNLDESRDLQQLYYRTDHHWTLEGACRGYAAFMGKESTMEKRKVCDDFLGTLFSKVLDRDAKRPVDEGGSLDSVYIPYVKQNVKVTADGKDIEMFDKKALEEKDKYKVYFGGNYGIVNIKVTDEYGKAEKGRKLVVIKDSFANSMVPLLLEDYRQITMIDFRFFAGDSDRVLAEADDILFLYELSNFAGDTNLTKLIM